MRLSPAIEAVSESQKNSLAELPKKKRYIEYERCFFDEDKSVYHRISARPITKRAEDDMELLSGLAGEIYLHNFSAGNYCCSQCQNLLFSSKDKWKGPCVWPSFRSPFSETSLIQQEVFPYNNYTVIVKELYCAECELFIGHCFEDGKAKGDTHPQAHWRH